MLDTWLRLPVRTGMNSGESCCRSESDRLNPGVGIFGFNQFVNTRARFTGNGQTAYVITATATGDNNTSKSFVYSLATGNGNPATPTSVVSRKTHGTAGAFDISLPLTGSAGIECRSGGANGNHQVVFAFPTTGGATLKRRFGYSSAWQVGQHDGGGDCQPRWKNGNTESSQRYRCDRL